MAEGAVSGARTDAAVSTMMPPPHLGRALLVLLVLRAIVVTVLLGATVAVNAVSPVQFEAPTTRFLLVLVGATYLFTGLYAVLHSRLKERAGFAFLQIGLDVAAWTALVYATGGGASGFTFLYGLEVVVGAALLGRRGALWAASLAWVLLAGLTTAMSEGLLPPLPDQPASHLRIPPGEVAYELFVNGVMLVLVAVLAGALAERLRRAGGALQVAEARTARAIRREEDIVRSITSGLLTADLEGRVETLNPAGERILGQSSEEVRGRAMEDVVRVNPEILEVGSIRAEASIRRPDGREIPIGFTVAPLTDEDGRGVGRIVSFQDMTEILAMRRAVQNAEQLAAVGRVAAGLAHEIRNPLGAISGSVELLRGTSGLGAEAENLLDVVLGETRRLNDLVTDILLFSRPRAPQRVLVDLVPMLRDVVTIFPRGTVGQETPIDLVAPASLEAQVDPGQIRQVLWNLLKNAVQATSDGSPVRVEAEPLDGGGVSLRVVDHGSGIPPEDRERIFDPFQTDRPRGIGIGLALVRQIVTAHDGRIEVDSTPGRGTTFRVDVPNEEKPQS